jgi:mycothiol synthase
MSSRAIPDFLLRPATPADRDAILALASAAESAEMGSADPAMLDGIATVWQRSDFVWEQDAWLACDSDGQHALGYALLHPVERTDLQAFADVHPDAHGRGIGTALLARLEGRADEQLSRFAQDVRVTLQQWLAAGNEPGHQLLEASGYAMARHIWGMRIDLAAAPDEVIWPEGITLRTLRAPATEADLRAVHAAYREAFQDHWGYTEQPYEDFARSMIETEAFDPSLWFLVMDGDEIAGVALDEALSDRGWVNDLAVRRPWRGRGLGEALLRHSFAEFYQRGQRTVALGVDSQNLTGATRLYERVGMHVERQYDICEKVLRSGHGL